LVALLHHIRILLVLVIWSVGLDDALDAVDCAWYSVSSDELGEVPMHVRISQYDAHENDLLVKKVHRDTKVIGHALQTDHTI
jgi:hypothetical protein